MSKLEALCISTCKDQLSALEEKVDSSFIEDLIHSISTRKNHGVKSTRFSSDESPQSMWVWEVEPQFLEPIPLKEVNKLRK